jgi:Ca2+/Na+ antiporter
MYNLFNIANNKKLYATIQKNESNLFRQVLNFCLACFYYWLVIIFGSLFSFIISGLTCFFTAVYTLISPLTYYYKITSYKIDKENESKIDKDNEYGIFRVLLNLFTYKKTLLMFLFSLSLIVNAGNELGGLFGGSAFLAVIILFLIGSLNDNIIEGSDPTLDTKLYLFK